MKSFSFYFPVFLCCFSVQQSTYAQSYIDSLVTVLKTGKEDTNRVNNLLSLGSEYKFNGQYDSSLIYYNKALTLAKKLTVNHKKGWKKGIANAHNTIGLVCWQTGEYGKALSNYFKAQKIFTEIDDKKGLAYTHNNIGLIYEEQGNYPAALKCYLDALKIMNSIGFKRGIAMAHSNMGNIYYNLNNDSAAFSNHFKALKIKKQINDVNGIALAYNNIGLIYDRQGKYDQSLYNYFKALHLFEQLKDKNFSSMIHNNIGIVYYRQKKYQEAYQLFSKSLVVKEEIGDKQGILSSYISLAEVCIDTRAFKDAEMYLKKALKLSLEIGTKDDVRDTYKDFYLLYNELGDYKNALENHTRYVLYKDSILNEETIQETTRIELQTEFEKKELVTKTRHDKKVLRLEAANKLFVQQRAFFIAIIVIVIALLVVAKRAYDNKKRIAEFTSNESHRKDVLLQEVHHRINNNLQIISSLLTLQANSAENEKLTEYLLQSQNRIQSLSVLHDLLYQNNSPLQINMREYLNKVLDFHRDVIQNTFQKVSIELNLADVSFETKKAVPIALIVNELVTNAIKYAFDENSVGKISIDLSLFDTTWVLKIADSGKGLPEAVNFRSDSLGLKLTGIMAIQMKGTLKKYNDPGATFEIHFPV